MGRNVPCSGSRRPGWLFFFYCYGAHRDLHSFPTRRSSDLSASRSACSRSATRCFSSWWGRLLLRSEEHTSELQSQSNLVCRLLLEKKISRQGLVPPSSIVPVGAKGIHVLNVGFPVHGVLLS